MNDWFTNPSPLAGNSVTLIPLESVHLDELESLARDSRIWEFYPIDASHPEKFRAAYATALIEKESGIQFPFVIYHNKDKKIIGSTRYLDIQLQHKRIEIGWTWLHHDYWATDVNFECKLLLLTHSFEVLNLSRVQLKTDETNARSRKAILKIGAKYEGILRHDIIRDNGTKRSTVYFSILQEEWKELKPRLTELYFSKQDKKR